MILQRYISRLMNMSNKAGIQSMRAFITALESQQDLKRIQTPISPKFDVTYVCQQTLLKDGPALLFENLKSQSQMPLLGNLFGSRRRVLQALNLETIEQVRELGKLLAFLSNPSMPTNFHDAFDKLPKFGLLTKVNPIVAPNPECREEIVEKEQVDLSALPIQTCWEKDKSPLITFGLVITKGPHQSRQNIGIYRQQVIAKNKVIMRWLKHRGGATDFLEFSKTNPGKKFPVVVALGADPATTLAAVSPIPDTISEFQFAGLLRGEKTAVTPGLLHSELMVPASAEIVLEGYIYADEFEEEGPFGDHTGYYNAVEKFPVFTIERITHRKNPIYHGTYMGKPPNDEPSVLASTLNEMFIPLLQTQFPEIVDFYLPPEACSYRMAIVSIKKHYPGHAKRVMFGIWSYLRQFTYTKFIVVVDDDIDARNWQQVLWAMTTRMDPARDALIVENTAVDYLDFASPKSGLGGKIGMDATHKTASETGRKWGEKIKVPKRFSKDVIKALNEASL